MVKDGTETGKPEEQPPAGKTKPANDGTGTKELIPSADKTTPLSKDEMDMYLKRLRNRPKG